MIIFRAVRRSPRYATIDPFVIGGMSTAFAGKSYIFLRASIYYTHQYFPSQNANLNIEPLRSTSARIYHNLKTLRENSSIRDLSSLRLEPGNDSEMDTLGCDQVSTSEVLSSDDSPILQELRNVNAPTTSPDSLFELLNTNAPSTSPNYPFEVQSTDLFFADPMSNGIPLLNSACYAQDTFRFWSFIDVSSLLSCFSFSKDGATLSCIKSVLGSGINQLTNSIHEMEELTASLAELTNLVQLMELIIILIAVMFLMFQFVGIFKDTQSTKTSKKFTFVNVIYFVIKVILLTLLFFFVILFFSLTHYFY